MQIAIDGPAGVGKSTLAKKLAQHLGCIYLDTGAMYRGVALAASQAGVKASDVIGMQLVLDDIDLNFRDVDGKKCLFDHERNIEKAIRQPAVSRIVSHYARLPEVRDRMTRLQQEIAKQHSVVMDGRDIGTVVLPNADYKIFLTASVAVRAKRRMHDFKLKGIESVYEEVVQDIARRDEIDSTREIAPLSKAEDAIEVDTSDLNEQEVFEKILAIIEN